MALPVVWVPTEPVWVPTEFTVDDRSMKGIWDHAGDRQRHKRRELWLAAVTRVRVEVELKMKKETTCVRKGIYERALKAVLSLVTVPNDHEATAQDLGFGFPATPTASSRSEAPADSPAAASPGPETAAAERWADMLDAASEDAESSNFCHHGDHDRPKHKGQRGRHAMQRRQYMERHNVEPEWFQDLSQGYWPPTPLDSPRSEAGLAPRMRMKTMADSRQLGTRALAMLAIAVNELDLGAVEAMRQVLAMEATELAEQPPGIVEPCGHCGRYRCFHHVACNKPDNGDGDTAGTGAAAAAGAEPMEPLKGGCKGCHCGRLTVTQAGLYDGWMRDFFGALYHFDLDPKRLQRSTGRNGYFGTRMVPMSTLLFSSTGSFGAHLILVGDLRKMKNGGLFTGMAFRRDVFPHVAVGEFRLEQDTGSRHLKRQPLAIVW